MSYLFLNCSPYTVRLTNFEVLKCQVFTDRFIKLPIIGTKGSLTLKMTWGSPKAIIHDDTTTEKGVRTETLWQGEEDNSLTRTGPVTDFAAAIREGRPPMTTLERSLLIRQITDAIYASAAAGRAVEIG